MKLRKLLSAFILICLISPAHATRIITDPSRIMPRQPQHRDYDREIREQQRREQARWEAERREHERRVSCTTIRLDPCRDGANAAGSSALCISRSTNIQYQSSSLSPMDSAYAHTCQSHSEA